MAGLAHRTQTRPPTRPLPRRDGRRVAEQHVGRRSVVSFTGELDLATGPELERPLNGAIERGAREVWADLTPCTFIAAGVHCLLDARRALTLLFRDFVVICEDTGAVRRVLTLTGAGSALELRASRTTAHRAR